MHDSYTSDKLANPHQHVELDGSYTARKGYRKCKICLESYVNLDSPSTRRALNKLLDFVNDPENFRKAAEGSMAKRQEIIDQASDQTDKQIEAILGIEWNEHLGVYVQPTHKYLAPMPFEERVKKLNSLTAQAVNEARKDEVRLYTNNIELNGGGFDPTLYEKNRLAQLTPKEDK